MGVNRALVGGEERRRTKMAIYSMGTMPAPRESDLAGLSRYTGGLAELGVRTGEAKKTRENEMRQALAKSELETKEKDIKHVRIMQQNLADRYVDKQDELEMFLSSDQGKEYGKLVKRVTGKDVIEVLPPASPGAELKDPEKKRAFEVSVKSAIEDMKANRPLTPDKKASMIKALEIAAFFDPSLREQIIPAMRKLTEGITGSISDNLSDGLAPEGVSDKDPLGILQ